MNKQAYVGVRMSEDTKKELEAAAEEEDRSVSHFVERLVVQALKDRAGQAASGKARKKGRG